MFKKEAKKSCDVCGKRALNTEEDPNIVQFVGKSGKKYNICRNCIIRIGRDKGDIEDYIGKGI